ncbi:hypothetical protein [Pseudomonas putida]|uniref:hypothetical protein n=1 Tax=Pseudomonas putida TaxID=303 RepID=UPI0018D824A6|nr:hypothetical protein [Pseudomonas putida]MBH3411722.1 hypothetical protein [Pseudomonas putida]
MSNSLEQVLARMRESSVTLGWGAVAVYSRGRLNRLLYQQHLERLGGPSDLPLLSVDLVTRPRRAAAQATGHADGLAALSAVSARRIGSSRVHVALDIDAVSAPQAEWLPGPSSAVSLSGIEFGPPLLSFSTASVENSRVRLTMNIVAGRCASTNKDGGKLFSGFSFSEAMDYQVEIDVDLALAEGTVDRRGRVLLDIAKGSRVRCNLFAQDPQLNQQLNARLAEWFARLPARSSEFELGSIDLRGYRTLTPNRFILRTQAAPGARLRAAANYGDGAVLVFIGVLGDDQKGRLPTRDFPYLLPDGDYSATLVVAEHLQDQASEVDLILLNSLLFPASYEFVERERHTPRDLAVFGNINPLRTTMSVQPAGTLLHAGEQMQFKLFNGEGRQVNASQWRVTGLTNHTLATQGSISLEGLYSAPDINAIGHESLTVVVTAEYKEGDITYVASERVQVAFERLELMPRVVSFAQNQQEMSLGAWQSGGGGSIDWSFVGPALGELGVSGAGGRNAVFKPYADTLLRPLAVQQLRAEGSETGMASLVMVNAQQLLGIEPRFVPRLQRQQTTILADTSGMLSTLHKRGRVLAGTGRVDGEGRFTATDETDTRSSVVVCEVVEKGVRYATDYSVVQQSQLNEEPTWKSLKTHDIKVPGGADLGTRGSLFGNGFQPLMVEVTVETALVDGKHYPLSLKEEADIGIYQRAATQRLPDLGTAQGIELNELTPWATRKEPNIFEQATTPGAVEMTRNDKQTVKRFYLHAKSDSLDIQDFHSRFTSDKGFQYASNDTNDQHSSITVTAIPTPHFNDTDYVFEGFRMDGGGTGFELPENPNDDEFYLHPNTVDYWRLKYGGGNFLTCQFLSSKHDASINTTSMTWENRHSAVEEMSFTGWIFYDAVKGAEPTEVQFDNDDLDKTVLADKLKKYLKLDVDTRVFHKGALVIVNRRVDDIGYISEDKLVAPGKSIVGGGEKFLRPLAVRLRDRYGHLHERLVYHLPESIVGHRNHLYHSAFDSAPERRLERITARELGDK